MKKKLMGLITVVAIATIAGYNMFTSPNDVKLSSLVMVNMEALAQGESSGGNCEPSPSRECCVCNDIHYMYQSSVNRSCDTKDDCNHWHID